MSTATIAQPRSASPRPDASGSPPGRLLSLDALRGLDMFFLVGFAGILRALPKLSDNAFFNWLAAQCAHPDWHGFTAYDVIFPMFIFIVGVAMPFSFAKRLQQEGGKMKLLKHVLLRTVVLTILGVILWQRPITDLNPEYGWYSVLYRIGFCYLFAAIILMNTGIRGQIAWAFGLVIGYWLALRFVPVPGFGMGDFSRGGNLQTYVRQQVADALSPDFRVFLSLSLIPSVANALFGVLTGHWLRSNEPGSKKAARLLLTGIAAIAIGLLIHLVIPINKKLETPSFTFVTCGISAAFLAVFYWVIDVRGYRKWAFFFVVVGMNSITIYIASYLFKFGEVANVLVGGFDLGNAKALALATTGAAVKWLFLYYLYRQRCFLNI